MGFIKDLFGKKEVEKEVEKEVKSLFIGYDFDTNKKVYTESCDIRGRFNQHCLVVGNHYYSKDFFIEQKLMSQFFDTKEHNQQYSSISVLDINNGFIGIEENYGGFDNLEIIENDVDSILCFLRDLESERKQRQEMVGSGEDLDKHIVIINGIDRFKRNLEWRYEHKEVLEKWIEINQLFEGLMAKSRSANISFICSTNSVTANNISISVRDNFRHRFAFQSGNISMKILFWIDELNKLGFDEDVDMELNHYYYQDIWLSPEIKSLFYTEE